MQRILEIYSAILGIFILAFLLIGCNFKPVPKYAVVPSNDVGCAYMINNALQICHDNNIPVFRANHTSNDSAQSLNYWHSKIGIRPALPVYVYQDSVSYYFK